MVRIEIDDEVWHVYKKSWALMGVRTEEKLIAFLSKKSKRDKWEAYLLIPVFLFFVIDLILDYVLAFDFRSTAIVGPYVLLYYVGLWGLIGYSFRFDKKWGFVTLATYFLNMAFSVIAHYT